MLSVMRPVIILVILVYTQASSDENTGRVVGGHDAEIEDFPWQVSISYRGEHVCGGSILNEYYILTAAHCFKGLTLSKFRIKVGTDKLYKGGQVYRVASLKIHPKFNYNVLDYDAAVLKVTRPLKFSDKVKTVNLPSEFYPDISPGVFATVSGFGRTSANAVIMSPQLKATDIQIVSNKVCQKRIHQKTKLTIKDNMLCAGSTDIETDACGGDSGGPLTIEDVQIGIVSWGIGCASPGMPGIYTNTRVVLDFIESAAEI